MYTVSSTRSILKGALAVLAVLVVLTGCGDDAVVDDGEEPAPTEATVFIANQGNFGDANGSVSTFDLQTEESNPTAVGPDELGTLVQSIQLTDERVYVASNTALRVDVFDSASFERVAQSEAVFDGPRYIEFVDDETAYVTNQVFGDDQSSTVEIVDFSAEEPTIGGSIEVSGLPEALTLVDNRVYVALGGFEESTSLAVIDAGDNELIEEFDIGCASRFVLSDQDDDVFAFCNTEGEIAILENGSTDEQPTRLDIEGTVGTAGPGQDAAYVPESNEMYVIIDEQEVVRLDTITNEVDAEIGPVGGDPIGAVNFEPTTEQLFLGRVPGFDVSGTVTIHDRAGTQTDEFAAGVAPTHIDIQREEE